MTRPLTEAGRAHLGALVGLGVCAEDGEGLRDILAIEAEARAAALAEMRALREAAQAMLAWTGDPYVDECCQVCGAYADEGHADCEAIALRAALLDAPAPSEPGLAQDNETCLDCGRTRDEPGVPAICSGWHSLKAARLEERRWREASRRLIAAGDDENPDETVSLHSERQSEGFVADVCPKCGITRKQMVEMCGEHFRFVAVAAEPEGLDVDALSDALRSEGVRRFVAEAWVDSGVSEAGYATPEEMARAIAAEYARLRGDRAAPAPSEPDR